MEKITSTAQVGNLQPTITIIFGELQPGVSEAYYGTLQAALTNTPMPKKATDTGDEPKPALPKLYTADKMPAMTPTVRQRAECLISTIDSKYPLLPGEYMVSESFSFLTKALKDIPARTVVLERKTNMATLYYAILNVVVDEEGQLSVKKEEAKPVVIPKKMLLQAKKKSLPMKFAGSVASALASKVGGFLGELIISQLFPDMVGGVPDYFDDVYKEITRIVNQKIDANTITTINGALNNLIEKLDAEYGPAKKMADTTTKEGRKILFDLLQKYDTMFLTGPSGMLGTLQDKSLSHAGYSVFMLGAGLQLGLLQEMAMVDPNNYDKKNQKWKSPLESSYGLPDNGTVAKTAQKYADYAARTWPDMLNKRRGQCTTEKFHRQEVTGFNVRIGNTFTTFHYGRINDMGSATSIERRIQEDEKNGSNPQYDAFVREALPPYKEQKAKEMIDTMSDPTPIINSWRVLVKQPVKV